MNRRKASLVAPTVRADRAAQETVKKVNNKRTPGLVVATLLATGLVLVLGVETNTAAQTVGVEPAGSEKSTARTGDRNDRDVRVDVGGAQVAIDPQTGRLRPPTREESQKLLKGMRRLVNQSPEGLKVTQHPDGSESVDLDGRFLSLSVAKRNADGTVSTECVKNTGEAAAFWGVNAKAAKNAAKNTIRTSTGKNRAKRLNHIKE